MNTNTDTDAPAGGPDSDSITLLEGGPYSETTALTYSTCVAPGYCLVLEMNDPSLQDIENGAIDLNVLATADLYLDDVRAGMGIFLGLSTTIFVGSCSPIQ